MPDTILKAFFAYPSSGKTLKEAIQEAVPILNKSRLVNIKRWEEYSIGGNFIINTICDSIDEAELFLADLTGLNPNVMFELGYAIAHNKRIWLIFDDTYKDAKKMFDQLRVLTTVGYIRCCNSDDIIKGFYKEKPFESTKDTIFRNEIERSLEERGSPRIFHLKRKYEDQPAVRVSNLLQKKFPKRLTIDDPRESTVQSLAWYGSNVFNCSGVVCHFMSPNREGGYIQTARHALVCGMAYGWKKPLLMLAEDDFWAPIDYRDRLRHYKTAAEALRYLEEWLPPVEQALKSRQEATEVQYAAKLAIDLRSLSFGDSIAENEEENLVTKYFIPTVAYDDAVRGNQTVFVGRKGSGKTANLIKLKDELSRRKQNLVCVIKPPSYQMQGIVDLLRQYQRRNLKGYAIETLWKFLLLSEIANTADNLENPPVGPIDAITQNFFNFVERNEKIIRPDFSTRLETCTQNLEQSIEKSNNENSYLPVSEALHSGILKQLRVELGKFLSKKQRVVILVDNLDQAWEQQNDIEALSEILWSLLEVAQKLPTELGKQNNRRQSIQLNLAIFLRSDIFYRIRRVSRERDKMPYSLLRWDDTESLCRIIEERFISSFETSLEASALWQQYFCPTINGTSAREYITETILKRPRDIIFFVNEAVKTAINRRHTRIEEEDILTAEKQYSRYVFESVEAENTLTDISLENVIFAFAGMPVTLPKSEVVEVLKSAEVSEEKIETMIDFLHDLTFLGLEIEESHFVFSDTPENSRKNKIVAQRFAKNKEREERFQIHRAFQAYLEVE